MKLRATFRSTVLHLTFALVGSNSVSAQTLTNFKTSQDRVPVNTPVTAIVEFKEADRNWCGFYIDWGDGKEPQSFRIGRKPDLASPVTRQRSFEKPGTYTLKAYGEFVSKGLQSAEKCAGTLQPITVTVYDPADEEEKKAQEARFKDLERRLKEAEAEAAKTPEQKAEEARVAAEAKAYAEAKVAAEMRAEAEAKAAAELQAKAEAKAAEAARAAEEKARDDLMKHVFSKKWGIAGLPCNRGAYQIFSQRLKLGWNMASGGKLLPETGNNARFSFEPIDGKTFRHVMEIYSGGNNLVTRALGTPNARVSYTVDEYTLIDKNTMRKTRLEHRKMNFDLMMKGFYREEVGEERGKVSTIKACR